MPETLEPPPRKAALTASRFLAAKMAPLRGQQVATDALTGLAMAAGVGVELLALAMFVDWWLDLPWAARLISLLAQLGLFAFILLRFIVRPILRPPDDDDLALMVEKARSIFRSRMIASVQLTRPGVIPPGASQAMVDALVQETEVIAAPMDFNSIVSADKLK